MHCVNGIQVYTADTTIANTLTEAQQNAIIKAVNNHLGENKEMALTINAIYKEALGKDLRLTTNEAVYSSVFSTAASDRATLNIHNNMLVKCDRSLFGGRYVYKTNGLPERVQLVREEMLVIGDILVVSNDNIGSESKLYLYVGDGKWFEMALSGSKIMTTSASKTLMEGLLAKNSFAILRPSLTF